MEKVTLTLVTGEKISVSGKIQEVLDKLENANNNFAKFQTVNQEYPGNTAMKDYVSSSKVAINRKHIVAIEE